MVDTGEFVVLLFLCHLIVSRDKKLLLLNLMASLFILYFIVYMGWGYCRSLCLNPVLDVDYNPPSIT